MTRVLATYVTVMDDHQHGSALVFIFSDAGMLLVLSIYNKVHTRYTQCFLFF